MAETFEQARANLAIANPEGSVKVQIGNEETFLFGQDHEDWLDDRAALRVSRQAIDEAEDQRKSIRQQARNHITILDGIIGDANITNTDAVGYIKDLARGQKRIIEVLIGRGIVE